MKNKKVLIILAIIAILIIVCGIIFVGLATLGIYSIDPGKALVEIRNTERQTSANLISNAFKNYLIDSDDYEILTGIKECSEGSTAIGKGKLDLEEVFVPDYLVSIPLDPVLGSKEDAGFKVCVDDNNLIVTSTHAVDKEIFSTVNLEEIFQEKLNNLNPLDNLTDAGDTQRTSDVTQILNAVTQFIAEGNSLSDLGNITICNTGKAKIGTDGVDLAAKLVPTFLVKIPTDPSTGTDADTGYTICKNNKGQISVEAPNAEGSKKIQVLR